MRKKPWMKKGKRVLALLREGTIQKTRTYVIEHQTYVYLFEVKLDDEDQVRKFHPHDVEEWAQEKL